VPDPHKLYLDQMFGIEVAGALRNEGYDVVRAFEVAQSRADDAEILQRAIVENRTLITLDEHFGDWVILPLSTHAGVIRIKVHPTTSKNVLTLLLPFLKAHKSEQFKDHLVILSAKRAKWVQTV
jgi:predicted nuclease of predicted toxin-antitoxin system